MAFLIIDTRRFPPSTVSAACALLGETLDDCETRLLTCGPWQIAIAHPVGMGPDARSPFVAQTIHEGSWPQPPGAFLRLEPAALPRAAALGSDAAGLRPLFRLGETSCLAAGSRPDLLAALGERTLSPVALAQRLLLGFTLDDTSIFAGVHRMRPGEEIHIDQLGRASIHRATAEPCEIESGRDWCDRLAPVIAASFAVGDALELSGGLDSRLVLAIGRRHGALPRLAFTLGHDDDPDVQCARQIAAWLRVDHIVLTPPSRTSDRTLLDDARTFAMRSGYAADSAATAWWPAVFRALAPHRSGQIGGGGGECSTGFYDTPLDRFVTTRAARLAWIRRRLFRSGASLDSIFDESASREMEREVSATCLRILEEGTGAWRTRTSRFYREQRVPGAGGPILAASACWYRPTQPLLHRAHLDAARDHSSTRKAQRALIARLAPDLGRLPYAADLAPHGARSALQRIRARLAGIPARPELGSATTAMRLASDPSVRHDLHALCHTRGLPLRPGAVADLSLHAAESPSLMGTLISTAFARQALESIALRLTRATGEETRRCAA